VAIGLLHQGVHRVRSESIHGGFTAEDYQRDILEGYIKPTFTKIHNRHYIIQEDNDGSHGTKQKTIQMQDGSSNQLYSSYFGRRNLQT
jgi:hypothetical protein